MKRFYFLFLFVTVTMHIYGYGEDDVVIKDITITMGKSVSVVPMTDAGLNTSLMEYPGGITISDETAILVVETKTTISDQPFYYWYSTLTLTPTKVGIYSLSQPLTWATHKDANLYHRTMTYNITVVEVKSISIPSSLSLQLGDEYTFSPIITDADAITTLTWVSSNSSVATISENGTLTTKGIGTTTISCTAPNGVSAQCEVTVNPVYVNSISQNYEEKELIISEQFQLKATVLPENATDKSLRWSTSNEEVAVVNENGLVTAVGAGLCNITAATKDGSELTSSCLINVLGNVIYCEDLGAVSGATVTLPVQMTNADAIQGFEFELELPKGVSVETDGNGRLAATLTERINTTGLDGALLENGNYKFVFTSTTRILGKEGAMVNVPLMVADDTAIGTYDIVVKNVELVKYGNSAQIHHGDRKTTLTIKEMTMGDVNGDGRVSVADAISIINYVLGRTPVSFITKAADVNGDGGISLADAVAVVDIILGRSGGNVKALIQELIILDPQ